MSTITDLKTSTVHWDKALIDKYDCRGPRYTSYPTAAEFNTNFQEYHYIKALESASDDYFQPISLYVHIPFCRDICYYCACNKIVTRDESAAETYLNHLETEMKLVHQHLGKKRRVSQLHFGGGTPTFLTPAQLTKLIHMLAKYFKLTESEEREYSIEIDPRTVSMEHLALLKGLGFNRISLGVQDFSPIVQQAINRTNDFNMVRDITIAARDLGYHSINFDLIYGLPHQNVKSLQETVEQVIELSPDRIAFYNYAHLPERFSSQRAIDRLTLPSADEKLDMLNTITEQLCSAGYYYIGMDHFVKPSDPLAEAQKNGMLQRNFQGYSVKKANDLIGLGVSAISSVGSCFSQNQKNIQDYYSALEQNKLPVERGLASSTDDERRRYVIMQLISNLQLEFSAWEQQFKLDFHQYFADELQALGVMQTDKLLNINEQGIQVLPYGQTLIRNICMVFDAYHNASIQSYSKVI